MPSLIFELSLLGTLLLSRLNALHCGGYFYLPLFGAFGGNEIIGCSKIQVSPMWRLEDELLLSVPLGLLCYGNSGIFVCLTFCTPGKNGLILLETSLFHSFSSS